MHADGPILADALAAFRQANGIPADEEMRRTWLVRLGPVTLRLPNFGWRRRAVLAHDLHHVLTGYPCTMGGECRLAIWELAAGRMPHPAARLFCLPLVTLGMLRAPRGMVAAFRDGRRSRTLYAAPVEQEMLAMTVAAARSRIAAQDARAGDQGGGARLVLLLLESVAVSFAPVVPILAACLAMV